MATSEGRFLGLAGALFAVVVLSACLDGFGGDSGGDGPPRMDGPRLGPGECVAAACLADPGDAQVAYFWERYGLTQVTDDSSRTSRLVMDSGWVAWAVSNPFAPEQNLSHDVFAYHVPTGELVGVAVDPGVHSILAHPAGGKVAYHSGGPGLGSLMFVWDSGTRETVQVVPGLNGSSGRPQGFDGDWLSFRNTGSPVEEENGYWAVRLSDGELVFVYRHPEEERRRLAALPVVDGVAYYGVGRDTAPAAAIIGGVGLESGEHWEREYLGEHLARMAVGTRFAAIESALRAVVVDHASGEWRVVSDVAGGEKCGFPNVGGDFATWGCYDREGSSHLNYALVYDFSSGEVYRYEYDDMGVSLTATDGEYLALATTLTVPTQFEFNRFHSDIFIRPLDGRSGS